MDIRPRRSVLYMPGANPRALEKARALPADALILDLEDAVAPDAKAEARARVTEADKARGFGPREVVIRINAMQTPWGRDDLEAAVAVGGADHQAVGAGGRRPRQAPLAPGVVAERFGELAARFGMSLEEVILRHALSIDRAHLYTNMGSAMGDEMVQYIYTLMRRRLQSEPTAYITGHREFYGVDLLVGAGVLVPRPDTETLVEEALRLAAGRQGMLTVADVGCGTGAIGIAIAANLPRARIYAIDLYPVPKVLQRIFNRCSRHSSRTPLLFMAISQLQRRSLRRWL